MSTLEEMEKLALWPIQRCKKEPLKTKDKFQFQRMRQACVPEIYYSATQSRPIGFVQWKSLLKPPRTSAKLSMAALIWQTYLAKPLSNLLVKRFPTRP
jgi:hypothetical protein